MVISRRRFAELRTGKKCTEIKKHVKGFQSFCFCSLNMQNLWWCHCRGDGVVELVYESIGSYTMKTRS